MAGLLKWPLWGPMEATVDRPAIGSGGMLRIRELEQRLQTIRPLGVC